MLLSAPATHAFRRGFRTWLVAALVFLGACGEPVAPGSGSNGTFGDPDFVGRFDQTYWPFGERGLLSSDEPDPAETNRTRFESANYSGPSFRPEVVTGNSAPGLKDLPSGVTSSANVDGAWSVARNWPLIAIHAALLPDGRVVTYGTNADGKQTGKFIYDIWDSTAARLDEGHLTLPNTTDTDIFCSSQTMLTTGQLLLNGGDNFVNNNTTNTGNNDSNLLDVASNTLTPGANMNRARWYSSVTALPDGRHYIQGGSGGQDRPEVRSVGGNFTLLGDADTSSIATLYPRNYLTRDGRVFGYANNGAMYFIDPTGTGYVERLPNMTTPFIGAGSTGVMYAPGKILQVGADNSNRALVIDINDALPVLTETLPVSTKRIWENSAVLPDGRVLITGGSTVENQLTGTNNFAELWDPETGSWHIGAEGTHARLYHSTSLLLPDATVLVAGGGAPGPLINTNAELYYPPYLFDSNGQFAARPVITSAPSVAIPGDNLSITVNNGGDINELVLIRTGSVTHSVNFDQRRLPLDFARQGNDLTFQLPSSSGIIPPGYYLVFAMNNAGVPSVGKILRVDSGDQSLVGAPWTGRIGGNGGGEFRLDCNDSEVMVGIHGSASSTRIYNIGPRCVAVDATGQWSGMPVNRGSAGGLGGSSFTQSCAAGSAVSGFSGRSGTYTNQLIAHCRPLASATRLTGSPTPLSSVGSNSLGSARAYRSCGANKPVVAVYGRSGSWLDAFGMRCTPNSAAELTDIADQENYTGDSVSLQVEASDVNADSLTFSALNLPEGLSIGVTDGLISGTPSTGGTWVVTVLVNDGSELASTSFTWTVTALVDTDGDGIFDNVDTDDDNDGVPDTEDAFPLDPTETTDTDGDGTGNNLDTDDDNDGVADGEDDFPLDATETKDTDGDGAGDNIDPDADNDGIPDNVEAGGALFSYQVPVATVAGAGASATQTVDLSSVGALIGQPLQVTDVTAYGDLNSASENLVLSFNDGEFVSPALQTGLACESGQVAVSPGVTANLTVIDIGGGTPGIRVTGTTSSSVNLSGSCVGAQYQLVINGLLANQDQDNDGLPNSVDLDSDNDGQLDVDEAGGADSNDDGVINNPAINQASLLSPPDTDGDLIPDYLDLESNNAANDGTGYDLAGTVAETIDTNNDGRIDGNDSTGGTDANGNGIDDAIEAAGFGTDSDGDGIADSIDPDDDNDGVPDVNDAFPVDPSESVDSDGDGTGNNADPDDDNDGVPDVNDDFPLDASESTDTDGDGIGNNTDTDDDGDGVDDTSDAFPLDAAESVDTDGDGIGNNADTDDDGDGVPDVDDADPLDPDIGALELASIVQPLVTQPLAVNSNVTLTLTLTQALTDANYDWSLGDGTIVNTSVPTVEHAYTNAGRYPVFVTITRGGQTLERVATQIIHETLTANAPISSSSVVVDRFGGSAERVWNVNPDQGTVSVVDPATNTRITEINVGTDPVSLTSNAIGRLFVANKASASISVIDASSLAVVNTYALPAGSAPHGIVADASRNRLYVVLEDSQVLLALDADSGNVVGQVDIGPRARHLAINADRSALTVSRFITSPLAGESGTAVSNASVAQLLRIGLPALNVLAPISLANDTGPDSDISARGVPNYLMSPVISPDGQLMVVPFKSDNVFRGLKRDGNPRQPDRMIRGKLGRINLPGQVEDFAQRLDFNNNSPATAAAFGPYGSTIAVIHEASRSVEFIDRFTNGTVGIATAGFAPMGVAVSGDGSRTFVHNYLGRSLTVFDSSGLINGVGVNTAPLATIDLTTSEVLSNQVLTGKRLFHDGLDDRLVQQDYFSCASCHADGGDDGRTWDVTDVGEGLRNTIDLRGRAGTGHGAVHWTGNFDEIHDFEIDIREVFGGAGLLTNAQFNATRDPLGAPKAGLSADLDALAAYVSSLTDVGTSPYRAANGNLTADGQAGRVLFGQSGCVACHGGSSFTDSAQSVLHDIGTIDADSGERLEQPLTGFDTPTLRGLWRTAPYLHDGAATDLQQAVLAHTGASVGFDPSSLSATQMNHLVSYLLQIDDNEAAAPANDSDGDGLPDVTDPDDDNDGVDDINDAFPLDPTETTDTDGDGLGNNADTDDDGDGVSDSVDAFPLDPTESIDTDGDGIGNNTDTDDDGDGVPDGDDLDPLDPNVGAGIVCNLITDGGFESGVGYWYTNTTLTQVADANTGNFALSFGSGYIGNTESVTPGTLYTLNGTYKSTGTTGWAGYGVDFVNAAGDEVGELVRTLNPTATYTPFGLQAQVPLDAVFVRPWFYADPGRVVVLDDLDLRKTGCDEGGGQANQPPFLSNPGDQVSTVGEPVSLQLQATDPDGDPLTYSATNLPDGLTLDTATGVISGTPSTSGSRNVAAFVSDSLNDDETTFIWTVTSPGTETVCNILQNASFENGVGAWNSSVSPQIVADANSGNRAIRFDSGWISLSLPGEGGKNYTLSGHYMSADLNGWAGYGIDYLDAAGNEIGEEVQTLNESSTAYSGFSVAGTAPAGTATLRLWFYADAGRTLTLDDLDVRETGCVGGGGQNSCNRVVNPYFEVSTGGWFTNTTPTLTPDAGQGQQSVSVSDGWFSTVISVTPGDSYTVSALVKAGGNSNWSGMGMDFVNSAGQKLDDAVITIPDGSTYEPRLLTATAPSGATQVQVWFYADTGRTIYIDAVDVRDSSCQ